MNKNLAVSIITAIILTSCAHEDHGGGMSMNDSIPCPNGILNCDDTSATVDTAKTRLKGITGFTLFDINNRNKASDIRLFFGLLDNISLLKELRLILVKSDSASSFDSKDAESNPFFTLITPIQQDIKKTLPPTAVDSDGDSIVNGVSYTAFVYLVGKDTSVVNAVSAPSDNFLLENRSLQDMYVSSRGANAVILFDGVTGEYIKDFVPNGSGGLNLTQDVLFGVDGNLLVSGRGNTAIKKYDSNTGTYIGNFTSGYSLDEPTKISLSPNGTLLVSQWGQNKTGVAEFDGSTGVFIREIIPSLNLGMDHAWDADSNLYVVSYGSQDVRKYDAAGNFSNVLISSGLQGPVNLWFNTDFSVLYIVNWANGTVGKYMPSGVFISTLISGLNTVEGFAFDDDNHIYLCEWGSNRIKQYDYATGSFIKIFTTGHVVQPNSIAFGPNVDP